MSLKQKIIIKKNSILGGTRITAAKDNSTTKITNLKTVEKTTHTTIDNDYRFNILKEVQQVIPIIK